MSKVSRVRGASVVVAALLLLTAWAVVTDGYPSGVSSLVESAKADEARRVLSAAPLEVDATNPVAAPAPSGRVGDTRPAPVWLLAGLLAALLALCALRRLRDGLGARVRPAFLRGGVGRRAPPRIFA